MPVAPGVAESEREDDDIGSFFLHAALHPICRVAHFGRNYPGRLSLYGRYWYQNVVLSDQSKIFGITFFCVLS